MKRRLVAICIMFAVTVLFVEADAHAADGPQLQAQSNFPFTSPAKSFGQQLDDKPARETAGSSYITAGWSVFTVGAVFLALGSLGLFLIAESIDSSKDHRIVGVPLAIFLVPGACAVGTIGILSGLVLVHNGHDLDEMEEKQRNSVPHAGVMPHGLALRVEF